MGFRNRLLDHIRDMRVDSSAFVHLVDGLLDRRWKAAGWEGCSSFRGDLMSCISCSSGNCSGCTSTSSCNTSNVAIRNLFLVSSTTIGMASTLRCCRLFKDLALQLFLNFGLLYDRLLVGTRFWVKASLRLALLHHVGNGRSCVSTRIRL